MMGRTRGGLLTNLCWEKRSACEPGREQRRRAGHSVDSVLDVAKDILTNGKKVALADAVKMDGDSAAGVLAEGGAAGSENSLISGELEFKYDGLTQTNFSGNFHQ